MYTLYYHPFSFFSLRVVALLAETGLTHELRLVDLSSGEHQSDAYRQLNPNCQVPLLVDGDLNLAESNAILRYLCTRENMESWYPTALGKRVLTEQWLDWNQCRLSEATRKIVFNTLFAGPAAKQEAIEEGRASLASLLPILDAALAKGDYITGDVPTIADLSVASCFAQLGLVQIEPQNPAIADWYARMQSMKGFSVALKLRDDMMQQFRANAG